MSRQRHRPAEDGGYAAAAPAAAASPPCSVGRSRRWKHVSQMVEGRRDRVPCIGGWGGVKVGVEEVKCPA